MCLVSAKICLTRLKCSEYPQVKKREFLRTWQHALVQTDDGKREPTRCQVCGSEQQAPATSAASQDLVRTVAKTK